MKCLSQSIYSSAFIIESLQKPQANFLYFQLITFKQRQHSRLRRISVLFNGLSVSCRCLRRVWLKSWSSSKLPNSPQGGSWPPLSGCTAFLFTAHLHCVCMCMAVVLSYDNAQKRVLNAGSVYVRSCVRSNTPHSLFILLAALTSCTVRNLNNKAIHTEAESQHEVMCWVGLPSSPRVSSPV